MFQEIPQSLLARLHQEMYWPVMCNNVFFCKFLHVGRRLVNKLCHHACWTGTYLPHLDVFVDNTTADNIYLVTFGKLAYYEDNRNSTVVSLASVEPVPIK